MRLATYEDEEEYEVLAELFEGRPVPNTAFLLLEPDGTPMTRTMRGPAMLVGSEGRGIPRWSPPSAGVDATDPAALATILESRSARFPSETPIHALPTPADLRLALNVAACDSQPLVVVTATDEKERARLRAALSELAWSEAFVGRAQYVFASAGDDLTTIAGAERGAVLVVRPGRFGQTGDVVAKLAATSSPEALVELLGEALGEWEPIGARDSRQHVRDGQRDGVGWETRVPVSDPNVPERSGHGRRERREPKDS